MEFVEPIKEKAQIEAMKQWLKHRNHRDYLLFVLGINSGLRISDLLKLTVESVAFNDRLSIKEAKTGKTKDFPLSPSCKLAINEYLCQTRLSSGVLFPSRKLSVNGTPKAISRQQAYDVINSAAIATKVITETNGVNIGTHTLRKTFGYHAYKQGVSLEIIQKLLNHSAPSITLRYIGITKDELDNVYVTLNL